ncbi:PASTA domain-containing protein [Streptomyces griseoflavus Tu4000]|uniref:PASTA domain-containing protein n=1 Tax=Streptomyces griseoflavus Tu4000 TaxID=467200 RepID=D9XXP6_9ACTN|nr:PASTA domain-containing protein [Streptomyces griseoflavus Tu4000]
MLPAGTARVYPAGTAWGVTSVRMTPGTPTPEVRVPRLVGLMAVDARESARSRGLSVSAPDRPDFAFVVVDYVVRQYPQPGTEVPRDSVVHVWLDFGEGEGGGGVVLSRSRGSARRRAPAGTGGARPGPRGGAQLSLKPRCSATTPPVRLRHATFDQPAPRSRPASAGWSGQSRMDSAR